MTGYILKALNIYPITTLNSHLWVYFKCAQFFTTGCIVITLGQSFKMGAICNWQAHFGHSGSKHSDCAQFLTLWTHCGEHSKCTQFLITGYIVVKCCLSPQCTHYVPTGYMGPCPQCRQVGIGPIQHPEVRNRSEGMKRVQRPVPEKAQSRGTSTDPSTARMGG